MSHDHGTPTLPAPGDPTAVRLCILAITKHGVAQARTLAAQWPQAEVCTSVKFSSVFDGLPNTVQVYAGALSAEVAGLMARYDQLVCFVSLGAVVRLIAPYLRSKDEDPGVTVVDDAGQFVIPVLSGHMGGANDCALQVAALLGATAVLTTASDVGKTIAVDILGRELGWTVECPKINITRVSACVVNEEPVALVQEAGSPHWWTRPTPLPTNIHCFTRLDAVDLNHYKAVLWITHAAVDAQRWHDLHERLVVYRPPQGQGA